MSINKRAPIKKRFFMDKTVGLLKLNMFKEFEPVAQLVEQRPFKPLVRGSNPRWLTNQQT